MICPVCNGNTLENQHGVRLVCVLCSFDVELPGQSAASKEAYKAKIEEVT